MNAPSNTADDIHAKTTTASNRAVLQCQRVSKVYTQGALSVRALNDVSLEVEKGECLAVVGASGSGKSTLLHILGGLARPSVGEVWVAGKDINALGHRAAGELRNHALGFVYQFHHLLTEFTALENVAMPLLIGRVPRARAYNRAGEILERVGLGQRTAHKPGELSGGERQRAAVARAMVTRPQCILADEPTGNLDSKTAEAIHGLMLELNRAFGTSLVVATHDRALAQKMTRVITIEDGAIADPARARA